MRFLRLCLLLICLGAGFSAHAALNDLTGTVMNQNFYEDAAKGNQTTSVTLKFKTSLDYGSSVEITAVPQGNGSAYATPGTDFSYPSTFSLGFAGYESSYRIYTGVFTIKALPDDEIESQELINMLFYPTKSTSSLFNATFYLNDSTARPAIGLQSNTGSGSQSTDAVEGHSSSAFIITRSGVVKGSLTVYFTLGGTAQDGEDYEYVASNVTFLAGQTSKEITITPIDDSVYKGTRSVTLTVLSNSNYSVSSGLHYLNIVDDDPNVTPTPTPTPTATPTPTPTPTPNPLGQTQIQPWRVIGLYKTGRAMFSADGKQLTISHGPLIARYDASSFIRQPDLNNMYFYAPGYTSGSSTEYFYQQDITDFSVGSDHATGVITFGTVANLWSFTDRYVTKTFDHGSTVTAVAYETDTYPALAATGSASGIKIWNASTGELRVNIKTTLATAVTRLVISPDTTMLLAAFEPDPNTGISYASLYNAKTGETIAMWGYATGTSVTDASFSPDGDRMILGSTNGRVQVISLTDYSILYSINTTQSVHFAQYLADGSAFVTQYKMGFAVWDADNYQLIAMQDDVTNGVPITGSVSPDGTKLAITTSDGFEVFDLSDDPAQKIHEESQSHFSQCAFSKRAPVIFANDTEKGMSCFNYYSGLKLYDFDAPGTGTLNQTNIAIVTNPTNTTLATLSTDFSTTSSINIYEGATGKKQSALIYASTAFTSLAMSADGTMLAAGRKMEDYVWLFDPKQTTTTAKATYSGLHNSGVNAVGFYDTATVFSAGSDALALLYDWAKLTLQARFDYDGYAPEVNTLDLSSDKKELLTSCNNKILRWDMTTKKLADATTTGRLPALYADKAAGYILSSAPADNTSIVWNKSTHAIQSRFKSSVSDNSTDKLYDVSFDYLIFSSRGGTDGAYDTIWLWPVGINSQSGNAQNAASNWALYE